MSDITNLQLIRKFFTDTFGAICFYNDSRDGYVEYGDGNKKIETLSVYFPNKLDLYDNEVKSRLTKVAGKTFYKRYSGAEGKMVCGMLSSKLLVAYYLDEKTLGVCNYLHGGLKGQCDLIFDYFCGIDLNGFAGGAPCFSETVQTNNGLKITKGTDIQDTLEEFLYADDHFSPCKKSEYFWLQKKSKYYPVPEKREMTDKILAVFPQETECFSKLAERRSQRFQQLFAKLSKEDFFAFEKDMGISSGLKDEP